MSRSSEGDAVTRLEVAVWPVVCGGGCVFVIAAGLSHAPWRVVFAVLVVAVAAWSLRAPLIASIVLAGLAWLLLTGLDVNADGRLRFTGLDDGLRLGVLMIAGLAGMAVGWMLADPAVSRVVDGMPGPPEAYAASGGIRTSGISDDRYCRPKVAGRFRGAAGRASARSGALGHRRSGKGFEA